MANGNGNGNGRRKSRKRLIFVGGGVVLLAVFGLMAARGGGKAIDPSRLAAIEKGDLARSVVATGKVQPLTKVEIKSKASGIVKRLFVDYGDTVKEGQVLAELDREQLEAAVREARANLLAAEAAWERNKIEAEGPDLPFLKSALERARKLYADGLIAPSLLEDADKAWQMGLNKQTAAKSQAAVSKAEVEKARAALERYETDLRYATITSPMDGLVLSRDVEVGDAVSSILVLGSQATLVMSLGDVSEVYVLGKVDEADIGTRLHGPAGPHRGRVLQGQVVRGQGHEDLAPRQGEGQRHHLRGAGLDPQPRRRAQDQHDRERRDHPRGEEGRPHRPRVGGRSTTRSASPPSRCPTRRARAGKRKIAVKLGISNGVKTELVEGLKEGDKVVLQ